MTTYRVLHAFCGAGGGALGFAAAERRLFDTDLRFGTVGGIDVDAEACADFEHLTGAPALCTDIATLTVAELRAFAGERAPDVVFGSPPCKGASGLLSEAKSKEPKYEALNGLVATWTRLMLEAWPDEPPRLLIYENVPRITTRAKRHLAETRRLLRAAGYIVNESYHDCGEIGGLAQHRRRWLMVARLARRCSSLLYHPVKRRVRACGEVLGDLPVPATPEAERFGRLHELPKISWLNWVRLALIPAGGDWRDLEGVLAEGESRREKFRRRRVEDFAEPTGAVTGDGANAVGAVADPRVESFGNVDRVRAWDEPLGAVGGARAPSGGAPSVADPRIEWFRGTLGVQSWEKPSATLTGRSDPSTGRFAVADPRVSRAYDAGYAVLSWEEAARTIAGTSAVGCGAYAVGDPRAEIAMGAVHGPNAHNNKYRVVGWDEATGTVIGATRPGSGAQSVADPRIPSDPRKAPNFVPVIVAKDGTWHRPLTTLELAVLQGFPELVRGEPLSFAGSASSRWRERVGNAVPPPAARAIAEQMLLSLAYADAGAFTLSGDSAVWVDREVQRG
jgi:site-specific DNA-cytosine methylase